VKGKKLQHPTKSISTFIRSLIGMELLTHRVPFKHQRIGGMDYQMLPIMAATMVNPLFLSLSCSIVK